MEEQNIMRDYNDCLIRGEMFYRHSSLHRIVYVPTPGNVMRRVDGKTLSEKLDKRFSNQLVPICYPKGAQIKLREDLELMESELGKD